MKPVFHPPQERSQREPWRLALDRWREATRTLIDYRGDRYSSESYRWAHDRFSLFVLNVWDAEWYDNGSYHTQAVIDRVRQDYGGIDIVLLWNGYPRIGLDDRNQFTFWQELDGGLPAIRSQIDVFHENGIRCAIPFLPWDGGTKHRSEIAEDDLCDLIRKLDLDAVFLDTLAEGTIDLRRRVDAVKPGVVFVPEGVPDLETIDEHQISWMQGYREHDVPGILRNKVFEQRHMQWEVRRWTSHHDDELQRAWLNGTGTVIWENVFGTWVGTDRVFKTSLSLMRPIQKRYARLFATGTWHPLCETDVSGLWASHWTDGTVQLWTLVNKSGGPASCPAIGGELDHRLEVYDLVQGCQVPRDSCTPEHTSIPITIPAGGVGCIVAVPPERVDTDWSSFLNGQAERYAMYAEALQERGAGENDEGDSNGTDRVAGSTVYNVPRDTHPTNQTDTWNIESIAGPTIILDPSEESTVSFTYRVRECHLIDSMDRFHWIDGKHKVRKQNVRWTSRSYAIGAFPVTNAQYRDFLTESGYVPSKGGRFLSHWENDRPAVGDETLPVTNITPEDAWAYARWYGARLPTAMETLYASEKRFDRPFRRGDIWEITADEYTDGHTRFVLLTGGSSYQAEGSSWYFDGGELPDNWIAKMIRFCPGIDRCDTVGFRIAYTVDPE